eukprot:TRINITY_DN6364_c0_g1_i3.p1 TRINITY_DN6364_c0_g1~~TRINITY_DN6364_c0_g1_i3.p1  ORF type:complete len:1239 (+),score=290.28 TRINITY_DN6364_c0_g1_i3:66-3782(+)
MEVCASEQVIDHLRRSFAEIDKSGCGKVDFDGFIQIIGSLRISLSREQAFVVMQKLDTDLDGCITVEDLIIGLSHFLDSDAIEQEANNDDEETSQVSATYENQNSDEVRHLQDIHERKLARIRSQLADAEAREALLAQECDELKKTVDLQSRKIVSLAAQSVEMQSQLADLESRNTRLEDDMEALKLSTSKSMSEYRKEIDSTNLHSGKQVDTLLNEKKQLERKVVDLSSRVRSLENENDQIKTKLDETNMSREHMQRQIIMISQEKDHISSQLMSTQISLQISESERMKLQHSQQAHEEKIERLKEAFQDRSDEIKSLYVGMISDRDTELEQLRKENKGQAEKRQDIKLSSRTAELLSDMIILSGLAKTLAFGQNRSVDITQAPFVLESLDSCLQLIETGSKVALDSFQDSTATSQAVSLWKGKVEDYKSRQHAVQNAQTRSLLQLLKAPQTPTPSSNEFGHLVEVCSSISAELVQFDEIVVHFLKKILEQLPGTQAEYARLSERNATSETELSKHENLHHRFSESMKRLKLFFYYNKKWLGRKVDEVKAQCKADANSSTMSLDSSNRSFMVTEGFEELKKAVSERQEQIQQLQTKLRQVTQHESQQKEECASLRKEKATLEARLTSLDQTNNSLEKELARVTSQNKELIGELTTIRSEYKSLKHKVRETESRALLLEGSTKSDAEALSQMTVQLTEARLENSTLLKQVSHMQQQLTEATNTVKQLRDLERIQNRDTTSHMDSIEKLRQALSEKNIQVQELQVSLQDLSRQLERTLKDQDKAAQDRDKLRMEVREKVYAMEKLENELQESTKVRTEHQAKITKLAGDLKDKLAIISELRDTLSAYREQQQKAEARAAIAEEKSRSLSDEVESKAQFITELKDYARELQTQNDSLCAELKHYMKIRVQGHNSVSETIVPTLVQKAGGVESQGHHPTGIPKLGLRPTKSIHPPSSPEIEGPASSDGGMRSLKELSRSFSAPKNGSRRSLSQSKAELQCSDLEDLVDSDDDYQSNGSSGGGNSVTGSGSLTDRSNLSWSSDDSLVYNQSWAPKKPSVPFVKPPFVPLLNIPKTDAEPTPPTRPNAVPALNLAAANPSTHSNTPAMSNNATSNQKMHPSHASQNVHISTQQQYANPSHPKPMPQTLHQAPSASNSFSSGQMHSSTVSQSKSYTPAQQAHSGMAQRPPSFSGSTHGNSFGSVGNAPAAQTFTHPPGTHTSAQPRAPVVHPNQGKFMYGNLRY